MSGFSTFIGGSGPSSLEQAYAAQSAAAANRASQSRNQLGNIADEEYGASNALLPQTNSAFQDYMNYLGRNTTDQDRGAYVNAATNGLDQAYQGGQAGLAQNLRARGLSPDSSVGIGGLAMLDSMRANALGGATNDAYNYFNQQRQQNLGTIANATYGRQQTALGQAQGQYNQNQNSDMSAASMYANLQNQAAQRRQQQQQQRLQLLGQFAGGVGSLFGMGTPVGAAAGAGQAGAGMQSSMDQGIGGLGNGYSHNSALGMGIEGWNQFDQHPDSLGGGGMSDSMTMNSQGGYLSPQAQAAGRYNRFTSSDPFGTN